MVFHYAICILQEGIIGLKFIEKNSNAGHFSFKFSSNTLRYIMMLQLNDIKQPMISLKTQNNNHNETIKNVSKQFQQTLPKNYLEPLFYRITKKKASRIVRHAYISYFIRKKNKELQSITKIAFIFFPIFTHLHIFLPD